jgi:hypothetical protein
MFGARRFNGEIEAGIGEGGPSRLAAERNRRNGPKTSPYDRSPVPLRLLEAANTCGISRVLPAAVLRYLKFQRKFL